jgi:hypothetical protein
VSNCAAGSPIAILESESIELLYRPHTLSPLCISR